MSQQQAPPVSAFNPYQITHIVYPSFLAISADTRATFIPTPNQHQKYEPTSLVDDVRASNYTSQNHDEETSFYSITHAVRSERLDPLALRIDALSHANGFKTFKMLLDHMQLFSQLVGRTRLYADRLTYTQEVRDAVPDLYCAWIFIRRETVYRCLNSAPASDGLSNTAISTATYGFRSGELMDFPLASDAGLPT